MKLQWYPAASADGKHDDLEADLAGTGIAQWAWVFLRGESSWNWVIYAYWLWEDIDSQDDAILAEGVAATQAEAKAEAEGFIAWVQERE